MPQQLGEEVESTFIGLKGRRLETAKVSVKLENDQSILKSDVDIETIIQRRANEKGVYQACTGRTIKTILEEEHLVDQN
jgi:hypothetical protein